MDNDQLNGILDNLLGKNGSPQSGEGTDESAPRVAIPSPMVLTRDQEDALMDWAIDYDERLARDLGREQAQEERWTSSAGDPVLVTDEGARTFLGKRRLWEMIYNQKLDWRASLYGGVFADTNYTVPITRRYLSQMISRATNYFFGTAPWFNATPEGKGNDPIASEVSNYLKYKSRRKKLRRILTASIRNAFIRGEQVLKIIHRQEDDVYDTDAVVAVGPDGRPIVAQDGDYIYADDNHQEMDAGAQPAPDGTMQPVKMEILSRDLQTPWPGTPGILPDQDPVFQLRRVKRAVTKFKGAELSQVYFMDFLCPRNAISIEEAEFCSHHYDISAFELAQQILQTDGDEESRGIILDYLRELDSGGDNDEGAAIDSPRPELGEGFGDEGSSEFDEISGGEGKIRIAECYFSRDVNGDGQTENGFIMIDLTNGRPIYYNHVANVTPDGKRPFAVVRINPVDNRWHGGSMAEVFEIVQKFGDLMVNRFTFATSKEGQVIFWNPEMTVEGENNPNLELNSRETWTPKDPDEAEKILYVVNLYDGQYIQHLYQMLEFNNQWAANMSGVAGSNDGQAAGLDSSKLATGIRELHKTGQELFAPLIDDLEEGLTEALEKWSQLELHHLDGPEVYEFTQGNTTISAVLDHQAVRDLFIMIRMELTRYHNEQLDAQMAEADVLVESFFSKHPIIQMKTLAFYRHRLQLREVPNVDELLIPFTPQEWFEVNGGMLAPPGQAPPGGAGPGISNADKSKPSPI